MGRIQVFCFFASYLVVFGLELSRLLGRSQISRAIRWLFAVAGFAAHTAFLAHRASETNLPPLLSSSRDWLLLLAWLAVASYLFLTLFDPDLGVGVFLFPMVELLIGAAYLVSDSPNTRLDALYGWKMLHAALLVLGILGALVSFILGLMYVVQQSRLRHRQTLRAGFGLPSLEKLSRLNRWAVLLSVPLLTLGMATGIGLALYARQGSESIRLADPIVIGNGIVWLAMVALFVWLATARQPPGRQVASLTIWICGFLLVTLLALQILTGKKVFHLETWHVHSGVNRCSPWSVAHHHPQPEGVSLRAEL